MWTSFWKRRTQVRKRSDSFRLFQGQTPVRRLDLAVEPLETRDLPSVLTPGYGHIPLSFEANQGQTDAQVRYLARGPGYGLFLTPAEAVLSLQSKSESGSDVLRLQFEGANAAPALAGLDPQPGVRNYYTGSDPSQWHPNVTTYGRVAYQGLYPGVDLVFYGNQQQLEYDFVVAPGADPSAIGLMVQGAHDEALNAQGDLVLQTDSGAVTLQAPVVYQEFAGSRVPVPGQFILKDDEHIGFTVGPYDVDIPLVIDPVLSYSTYLGGSGSDQPLAIAVDAAGNTYVTGSTTSVNFPVANALQGFRSGLSDVFVAKLDASGFALLYSTYLGGSDEDRANAITVDAAGNAYLTGLTISTDFPTTQSIQQSNNGSLDAIVAKLDSVGRMSYSTYLGGSRDDEGRGIATDGAGNVFVTGGTSSDDFPTVNPLQATNSLSSCFVTKINAQGTALVYSTYIGGFFSDSGDGVAVDSSGTAYVVGSTESRDFPTQAAAMTSLGGNRNVFVLRLNTSGSALLFSTYITSNGRDHPLGVALDGDGDVYVTGQTSATNFPLVNPLQTNGPVPFGTIAFVSKFSASGDFLFSTYLGGGLGESGNGIAIDAAGNVFVAGQTSSPHFPVMNALQPSLKGITSNAFVTEINATNTAILFSTYLGGSDPNGASDIAVDGNGNVYITGSYELTEGVPTNQADFPLARPLQPLYAGGSSDAFVAKIDPRTPPRLFVTGADAGGGPDVKVFDAATGQLKFGFFPYDVRFTGGVRVAVGDVNGDLVPDVVCAAGPGGGPNISIFSGADLAPLRSFFAFGQGFAGGLYVAAGDVNLDGFADVVVGADAGGGANVAVFDGRSIAAGKPIVPLMNFFPYGPAFTGGVRVAAGDVTGDGRADLICGAGPGGGPNVSVIDGASGGLHVSFFPYPETFTGGVYVAVGDVTGKGTAAVLTAAGPGGFPQVAAFAVRRVPQVPPDRLLNFLAYDVAFAGGVRVGAVDRNGDGFDDVLSSAGPGGGPDVKTFNGVDAAPLDQFFAYGQLFRGGLFIAGG